jgi:hypothetical protein
MDSREIAAEFKKYSPELVIGSIMDGGNDLIVYLTKPNLKKGEYTTDQEYRYNKATKKITPFRITDDPELYRRAERHIVYMRPGLRDE